MESDRFSVRGLTVKKLPIASFLDKHHLFAPLMASIEDTSGRSYHVEESLWSVIRFTI